MFFCLQIFKFGRALKVKKILDRPINGTTTTIYFGKNVYERGFLNRQNFKEILENFALDYPQVIKIYFFFRLRAKTVNFRPAVQN